MINFRYANRFCCDDISLIENYEAAINDTTQTWHCHHRLETDLELKAIELKEQGLYFNRPASELIFLTHSEHSCLHKRGYKPTEETKQKQSDVMKRIYKDPKVRQKAGDATRNRPWMSNGLITARPKTQEEIEHYLELGFHFGRK